MSTKKASHRIHAGGAKAHGSPSQNRRHCHICRSPKDISKIVFCHSGKRSHIFCSSCVERRLGRKFADVLHDPTWVCPKCAEKCPCSKCRKKDTSKGQPLLDEQDAAITLLNLKRSPVLSWTSPPSSPVCSPSSSPAFLIPSSPTKRAPKPVTVSPSLAFSQLSLTPELEHTPTPPSATTTASSPGTSPPLIGSGVFAIPLPLPSPVATHTTKPKGSLNMYQESKRQEGKGGNTPQVTQAQHPRPASLLTNTV